MIACDGKQTIVDGAEQLWNEFNPNWIPPEDYPKWCYLRVDNGFHGCELWIRLLGPVDNTPQWHQIV